MDIPPESNVTPFPTSDQTRWLRAPRRNSEQPSHAERPEPGRAEGRYRESGAVPGGSGLPCECLGIDLIAGRVFKIAREPGAGTDGPDLVRGFAQGCKVRREGCNIRDPGNRFRLLPFECPVGVIPVRRECAALKQGISRGGGLDGGTRGCVDRRRFQERDCRTMFRLGGTYRRGGRPPEPFCIDASEWTHAHYKKTVDPALVREEQQRFPLLALEGGSREGVRAIRECLCNPPDLLLERLPFGDEPDSEVRLNGTERLMADEQRDHVISHAMRSQ
jgi:hypothetical protein